MAQGSDIIHWASLDNGTAASHQANTVKPVSMNGYLNSPLIELEVAEAKTPDKGLAPGPSGATCPPSPRELETHLGMLPLFFVVLIATLTPWPPKHPQTASLCSVNTPRWVQEGHLQKNVPICLDAACDARAAYVGSSFAKRSVVNLRFVACPCTMLCMYLHL